MAAPRAPYAGDPAAAAAGWSRSRRAATRSPFQRDRDRIIHSTAFRRLNYKTQVFVYHEGDHYRTRLTHSSKWRRSPAPSPARSALDEDLAEALALAHDLGHPPFGHAGERALDAACRTSAASTTTPSRLRVVTQLERTLCALRRAQPHLGDAGGPRQA